MTSSSIESGTAPEAVRAPGGGDPGVLSVRLFGWMTLGVLAAFLINNYLTHWQDLPGVAPLFDSAAEDAAPALAWLQLGIYLVGLLIPLAYVVRHRARSLRDDSKRVSDINAFFIRGAFWAVLLVGLAREQDAHGVA